MKALIRSDRVPAGITYEAVKIVPCSEDKTTILCLMLRDGDALGRKFHERMRADLQSGDTETLDADLGLATGAEVCLCGIERYHAP